MRKVFLDSSVLVAACASKTGASAFILGCCRIKKIKGYTSLDVLKEAKKNIELKLDRTGERRFLHYLKFANLILVSPPAPEDITQCEEYIYKKDAPILAAALKSQVSFLITLDRKHFLNPKVIKFAQPLRIITPGDFIQKCLK